MGRLRNIQAGVREPAAGKPGAAPWVLLSLSCVGFISLGLPDGVLGVAWPSIRGSFGLPLDALGALLVSFTTGYVASSFAGGAILARMSVGTLLAGSCLATSASLFGYSVAPAWSVMVALGALAGLGAGAIDAGINTYVATHHSARTLSLLHAFYGVGVTTGPVLMTGVLMAGLAWQRGYALIAAAQLALAAGFAATAGLWPRTSSSVGARPSSAAIRETLVLRATQLGVATFFFYVGIELSVGVWIYSLLHEARGASMAAAGTAVSVYWGGLLLGRLVFGLVPHRRPVNVSVRYCIFALAAAAAILALDFGPGANLVAAAALGIAAGPIFPSLIATTPGRLDASHTANAVGFQVAASAVGGATLPALVGVMADSLGLEIVPLALLCAVVVLLATYRALERIAPVIPFEASVATEPASV